MYKYYEINKQGHNIRCKIYGNDLRNADKAVIFCTGFAGHKDNGAANGFAQKALSKHKNMMVLVFNWPAHGDDVHKKLVLEDCMTYLDLVIREVREQFGIPDIYCYATSFGGYLVLKYIADHGDPFRKIVLRCLAVDMYSVLTKAIMKNDEYDLILKGKDVQVGFDRKIIVTEELLEALKENDIRRYDYLEYAENILIIHGTQDEIASFKVSEEFADSNLIEFIPVDGADHRFRNPAHMAEANKQTLQFMFRQE